MSPIPITPEPLSDGRTLPAIPAAEVRFAAVGDVGEDTPAARAVAERIAAVHRDTPIDALLLLGDLVYPDGDGARYEAKFARPYAPVLDAGIRLAAALGNHDIRTRRGQDMMRAFAMPGRYYDFTIGPVAFFALDSNRFDDVQLQWLRSRLSETQAPWRVLFMHVPAYSSGVHGSHAFVQRAIEPIVREHGVQLVLAAHDHNYERTVQIGPAVWVVAGTGCCLRGVGRSDFTAHAESSPGVVVVEATQTRMTLRFMTAEGVVTDEADIPLGAQEEREAA